MKVAVDLVRVGQDGDVIHHTVAFQLQYRYTYPRYQLSCSTHSKSTLSRTQIYLQMVWTRACIFFSLSTLLSKEVSTIASRTLEAGVDLHVRGTQPSTRSAPGAPARCGDARIDLDGMMSGRAERGDA
jgi:hypothetical protein